MNLLILNSGSSSIKFSIFQTGEKELRCVVDGQVSGIATSDATLEVSMAAETGGPFASQVSAGSVEQAIRLVLDEVGKFSMPDAVGYRVVHPGAKLRDHQRITTEVLRELEKAAEFAPLHDPDALKMIRAGMDRFTQIAHYACFDTVFHQTMPAEATMYPLPLEYREQGMRRYGFHGLSCESIVRQMRAQGGAVPRRMVIAHLGSGCSVTALVDGRSVDTSMGLTPTGGVVMGTRPGDLDPGLVLYLLREHEGSDAVAAVEAMLNHKAGMVGLSGMANDVKAMRAAAKAGNRDAALAVKIFARSITKAIGGFCWLLGGLDAITFSGGIGEHDAETRDAILSGMRELGVEVDTALNHGVAGGLRRISPEETQTLVLIVPSQEDRMIAVHVEQMVKRDSKTERLSSER